MSADGKQNQPDELKHAIFIGSRDVKIDPKNRLMLPIDFRRAIVAERDGKGFIAIVGPNQKVWIYTERKYYSSAEEQRSNMLPSLDEQDFNQMWYGQAEPMDFDGQERILVPDKILKRAKLGKDVSVVGVKDHMEIWNRTDWAAREEQLDQKRIEITDRTREAMKVMPKQLNVTYSG